MENEMKKYISIIAVFILIAIIPLAFAQVSGGVDAVKVPGTYKDLGPADQISINSATAYVKQKLGEYYFNQFIRFVSGISYETCIQNDCIIQNEITFNYNKQDLPTSTHLIIKVIVDNKQNIISYFGPANPYKFLLSEDDAIGRAKANGLKNVTGAQIFPSNDVEYQLVWVVWSNELAEECNAGQDAEGGPIPNKLLPAKLQCKKGVYVDVDTGEISGEFVTNPLILVPSEGVILNKLPREQKSPEKKEEISVNAEQQTQAKNVQDMHTQPQKEQKIGFFRKIVNWLKGLFS